MSEPAFIDLIESNAANITNGSFFIDKSMFIYDLLSDQTKNTLIVRPPKLCKTTNLSMTQLFLSPQWIVSSNTIHPKFGDTKSKAYFTGGEKTTDKGDKLNLSQLQICQKQQFFIKHQGQCPILLLSFGDLNATTFQQLKQNLKTRLAQIYKTQIHIAISFLCSEIGKDRVDEVLSSAKLSLEDPSHHSQIYNELIQISQIEGCDLREHSIQFSKVLNQNIKDNEFSDSLVSLTEMMRDFYQGRKVYVLVDNSDSPVYEFISNYQRVTPINKNLLLKDIQKAADLISSILNSLSKTKSVEKLVMTSKTALLNHQSNLNGIKIHTISSGNFKEYFCFTEKDVQTLLERTHTLLFSSRNQRPSLNQQYRFLQKEFCWQTDRLKFFDPPSIIKLLSQYQNEKVLPKGLKLYKEEREISTFSDKAKIDRQTLAKILHLHANGVIDAYDRQDLLSWSVTQIQRLLSNNSTIHPKIVFFLLEIDGFILPTFSAQGKGMGYRKTIYFNQAFSSQFFCDDEHRFGVFDNCLSYSQDFADKNNGFWMKDKNNKYRSQIRKMDLQNKFAQMRSAIIKKQYIGRENQSD